MVDRPRRGHFNLFPSAKVMLEKIIIKNNYIVPFFTCLFNWKSNKENKLCFVTFSPNC